MIANLCSLFWSLSLHFILPFHSKSLYRFSSLPLLFFLPHLLTPLYLCYRMPNFPSLPDSSCFHFPSPPSVTYLQVLTCFPTAQRNARPWATRTAAGCRLLCRPTGARDRTTAATCTSPAWTPHCPTLRYPPPSTSLTNSP